MRLPPAPLLTHTPLLRRPSPSPRLLPPPYRPLITTTTTTTALPPTINISTLPAPHAGTIRILSLNSPSTRNAISTQLLSELTQQITSLHAEGASGPTRALIIASAIVPAFCAGADLKERLKMSPDETSTFLHTLRRTFHSITTLPIPTLSAVASPALGGGLEIALTTDLRIFGTSASVALPETRLAILPGAGGTYRLPALIGQARALDMVLTGRRVRGKEAYGWGLCDRLVKVGDGGRKAAGEQARVRVLEAAVKVAEGICEGGPVAVREALRAVRGWRGGERVENEAYERVVGTEDRWEALTAFQQERKPVFTGR